ncbi:carboxylesterase/lipase family protein [Chloroflexota bacterium]
MIESTQAIIETKAGKIEGNKLGSLCVFKGIPYATAPVGAQRWFPPEPLGPWSGVYQARNYAVIAPQNPSEIQITAPLEPEPQNEDCLYLNVWTPGIDNKRRPVLFWIHGGGFTAGSGSSPVYSGQTLSQRGNVVVVTINYRLGLLGFLNLNEVTNGRIPTSGNEGLLDQIAALEWVRDNITVLGGDPDNVTILGESAGGMSVGCLLVMPKARGLFHKAILQSGAASTTRSLDAAVHISGQVLDLLSVSVNDVDALRSLTVKELLLAQYELSVKMMKSDLRTIMPLQPVVDKKTLPLVPLDGIKGGSAKEIPIIVGSTLDEWKLPALVDQKLSNLDEGHLVNRLRHIIPPEYLENLIKTYRKAREKRGVLTTPSELFTAIQTDRVFRIPAIQLAEAQQQHNQSVYNYLFTWRSPLFGGVLAACHTLELGFLFGTYEDNFYGEGPAADILARNMQDAWLSFVHNGNPSCESLGEWPPYSKSRETMILGEECQVKEAPYDEERRAWEEIPSTSIGSV